MILCPFCAEPVKKIGENAQSESFGCEPCGCFINRRKPKPADRLQPIGEIPVPKIGEPKP